MGPGGGRHGAWSRAAASLNHAFSVHGRVDAQDALLLYDDDCGLCTRTVAWVVARDRRQRVHPLAAAEEEGQELLAQAGLAGVEARTVVLMRRGRAHLRSGAVVRTLWALGGRWRVLGTLLWLVPWPVRELGYRGVARLRHRIAPSACQVP